ncbi:hypothetical protein [Mesonia aquimarina]|uniref:hypothetical protein n=1 Tax=Mesonia aquimarina TaxID=1504967 RepID=UPI000EF5A4C7|nr:hypothetical protein [Mesonia aquimarina]
MKNKYFITDFVKFSKQLKTADVDAIQTELKEEYKALAVQYPKFHKMDLLSKLGFIATELLQKKVNFPSDTALIFQNNASSLVTDIQHQKSIQEKDAYFPSPSIFVYTLPNIVMGEIAIRHQLQSENTFFISENFQADLIKNYTQSLLDTKKASASISGWIDLNTEGYNVFLAFISEKGTLPFTTENLQHKFTA